MQNRSAYMNQQCYRASRGGAWPGSRAGGIDVTKLSVSALNWVMEKLRESDTQTGREGFQGGGTESAELGGNWGGCGGSSPRLS